MPDSLEDNFTDVLGKAMRGLRLTVGELAARSGVPAAAIERVCGGQFDRGILEALAVPLKLNPVALAELPEYRPRAVAVGGLTPFSTSLGGMQVNSFVVCDRPSGAAAAFDTGARFPAEQPVDVAIDLSDPYSRRPCRGPPPIAFADRCAGLRLKQGKRRRRGRV